MLADSARIGELSERLPEGPHRRYNPLLDEWVLVSPQRLERPWLGHEEAPETPDLPAHDPSCYLCPGNERAGGARNPRYTSTFGFDNDFPALLRDAPPGMEAEDGGLLVARPERGICRVLCFTPRHDLTIARMDVASLRRVVDAWAAETATLAAREDVAWVQLFENKGALMGCSNPHPHCQVWATAHVPTLPLRKLRAQRTYYEGRRRDLLGDYLERELRAGVRIVCENADWVALVPFWAVWPFETMLLPRRRVRALFELEPHERDALAEIVQRLTVRYDNLFRCSFPYSMGWHGADRGHADDPALRLHAVYLPPLLRSSSVRKFLVGYELAAEPQRDLTPEAAAARLREQEERHYLDAPG
jgi:UDPglucose--hexose-1-phosphate uridylyltransferase